MRASMVETAAMAIAIFVLAAGFPTEWIVLRAQAELDTGGDALVSLLFIGLCGFLMLQMNGRWRSVSQIVWREPLLLFFLLWASMSVFWADDIALSGRRVIAMLVTTYLGAHLVIRFSQFEVLRLLGGIFSLIAFLNLGWILAFPQYSGPAQGQTPTDIVGFDARLTGVYDNANSLGRVMALATFTMVAALKLDRRRRPLYLAGLGAAILALALSQSKTSLVVSVLTTILLIVFLVFRSRKQLFGAVLISVSGSAVISVVLVLKNLSFLTRLLGRDVTLSGRVPLWKSVLDVLPERPVVGYGFNGYWNGWGSPSQEIWNLHKWGPPHAHNQFLDLGITLGAVGFVLFVALYVRTLFRATRHIRDVPGVFGIWPLVFLSFFLLISMTEAGLIARDITWFLFVAVVILVSQKKTSIDPLAHAHEKNNRLASVG